MCTGKRKCAEGDRETNKRMKLEEKGVLFGTGYKKGNEHGIFN